MRRKRILTGERGAAGKARDQCDYLVLILCRGFFLTKQRVICRGSLCVTRAQRQEIMKVFRVSYFSLLMGVRPSTRRVNICCLRRHG